MCLLSYLSLFLPHECCLLCLNLDRKQHSAGLLAGNQAAFVCFPSCFCLFAQDGGLLLNSENVILERNYHISWTPHFSGFISHGILPNKTLNRPNFSLLKSRAMVLLFALLPHLRIHHLIVTTAKGAPDLCLSASPAEHFPSLPAPSPVSGYYHEWAPETSGVACVFSCMVASADVGVSKACHEN